MWLWWAAATYSFLGAMMVRAASWPLEAQHDVTLGALVVYGFLCAVLVRGARGPRFGPGVWVTLGALVVYGFLCAVLVRGARGPRFGPGVWVTLALGIGQLRWGAWVLWGACDAP